MDWTTILAIASGIATVLAGAVATLWRTSVKAHAETLAAIVRERDEARAREAAAVAQVVALHEKRFEDARTLTREILEHVHASRRASEETSESLDAIRTLLRGMLPMR